MATLEMYGTLSITGNGPVVKERTLPGTAVAQPNAGYGWAKFLELAVEGWEAELDRLLGFADSQQGSVTLRARGVHTEF